MPEETFSDDPTPSSQGAPNAPPRPPIYHSVDLFTSGNEIWIEHGAEMYRLRITAQGKLLLTK